MTTTASPKSQPPVHIILDIAEATADFHHLFRLDQAWTGAAERGSELSDRDREALVVLGNKIEDLVATVERHAHNLRRIFDAYPEWVNERVRSELAGEQFTTSQREDAQRILAVKDEDFAGRGVAITDWLARQAPVERDQLRRKIPALRGNGPAVTDLSHELGCGLLAVSFMGSLLTCPKTSGIGCAVAFADLALLAHYC
jgi:hypothetical protein